MANEYSFPGYKLPVNPAWEQGTEAHGFVTPTQDRIPQVVSIPPRRALPIIFLPGTMGSNLRMSAARQATLGQNNNLAWRPDHLAATLRMVNDTAMERQLRLTQNFSTMSPASCDCVPTMRSLRSLAHASQAAFFRWH